MAAKLSLDSFDRKILDCLQDNVDMPLAIQNLPVERIQR